MIKFYHMRLVSGIVLVLSGVLALLQNSGVLPIPNSVFGLMFAFLFAALGLLFLGMILNSPQNWWAVFPGAVMLALGATIALGVLFTQLAWLGGAVFLGMIGLAFVWVYLANHLHWWAIIPGGTLLTLAVVSLGDHFPLFDGGTLFFLGLAVTFALVYFLPSGGRRMSWAWIPSIALFGMAAMISFFSNQHSAFLWPVLLIAVGLFLAVRSFSKKNE